MDGHCKAAFAQCHTLEDFLKEGRYLQVDQAAFTHPTMHSEQELLCV